MANSGPHRLFLSLPSTDLPVTTKDVVFFLYKGKGARMKKLGELRVSRGALVWRNKNDKYGRKIGWARLGKLLEEHGVRREKRPVGEKKLVSRRLRKTA